MKKKPPRKKRFTVTLDAADYSRLRAIARDHRPPLPLRYVVEYAIVSFLESGKQVADHLQRQGHAMAVQHALRPSASEN